MEAFFILYTLLVVKSITLKHIFLIVNGLLHFKELGLTIIDNSAAAKNWRKKKDEQEKCLCLKLSYRILTNETCSTNTWPIQRLKSYSNIIRQIDIISVFFGGRVLHHIKQKSRLCVCPIKLVSFLKIPSPINQGQKQ